MRSFAGVVFAALFAASMVGQAAPAPRPVSEQEAQSFGERVTTQLQRHDRRAVNAYRGDSAFMLVLVHGEQPLAVKLQGAALTKFLRHNLGAKTPVKTGTSCRYDAQPDGRVLESCISVNVLEPGAASFSVSLIARRGKGLYYQSTFVTDSERLARQIGVYGQDDEDDSEEENEDGGIET